MSKKIIVATNNDDKMKEIRMILKDLDYELQSLDEAGITVDIIEDGETFEENAIIKAKTVMEFTGEIVMADDSGLEVDALDKQPGIYSSRFLGEDTSYDIKNQYILDELKDVDFDNRTARFICAVACVFPDGRIITKHGVMEGYIGKEIQGKYGFGYDPIFWLPKYNSTSAQISPEEKNKESHRGKALQAIKKELENI